MKTQKKSAPLLHAWYVTPQRVATAELKESAMQSPARHAKPNIMDKQGEMAKLGAKST